MFDRLRSFRHLFAGLLVFAIPLVTIALSSDQPVGTSSSGATGWVHSGIGWLGVGQLRAFGTVGETWQQWVAGDLAEENEQLREQVDRLREDKSRLIGVLQENTRLRKLLGFKRKHPDYELAPAEVVGRDTTPYFRVLTLKLESEAKLEPRMPVVVAGGVVGQIHRTYGAFADVVIVSDPRSRIDAISQRNRAQGVIRGLGHQRDYLAKISYLRRKDEVRKGDVMVTSGMGGVFPPELIVGTVREVRRKKRGLFQQALVEPAVDYSRLEEVFVITDVQE